MSNVTIELDWELVIDDVLDKSTNQSEFDKIMSDCWMFLSNYPNFKINFVRRQTNFVANSLTKTSKLYATIFDYISSLPSCIFNTLMNEII